MSASDRFRKAFADEPGLARNEDLIRYAREVTEENERLEEQLALAGELLALYRENRQLRNALSEHAHP